MTYSDDPFILESNKIAIDYILNELSDKERNMLLLWYILGCNCKKLSNYLNVSQPYILSEIKQIKSKIKCFTKSSLSK